MNEQKLLESLRNQKRGALEKAIKQYTPYVSVVVYNVIGQAMAQEDIEEVVSSVFISLWRNSSNLDYSKGSIKTYLGTLARNSAKDKLRGLKYHLPLEDYTAATYENEPHVSFEQQEQSTAILSMIKELGEPSSEIFIRYYFYEEKVRYIAESMGLPLSTVKTNLVRGRQKLKKSNERNECL